MQWCARSLFLYVNWSVAFVIRVVPGAVTVPYESTAQRVFAAFRWLDAAGVTTNAATAAAMMTRRAVVRAPLGRGWTGRRINASSRVRWREGVRPPPDPTTPAQPVL